MRTSSPETLCLYSIIEQLLSKLDSLGIIPPEEKDRCLARIDMMLGHMKERRDAATTE